MNEGNSRVDRYEGIMLKHGEIVSQYHQQKNDDTKNNNKSKSVITIMISTITQVSQEQV